MSDTPAQNSTGATVTASVSYQIIDPEGNVVKSVTSTRHPDGSVEHKEDPVEETPDESRN